MDAISNGILLKSLERHFGSNLIPTILALFPNRVWTVLKKEFRSIDKQWHYLKTLKRNPSGLIFFSRYCTTYPNSPGIGDGMGRQK